MNKIHIIFILILFITSCRTTYDRELTIRNNIEKFKSDSIKKLTKGINILIQYLIMYQIKKILIFLLTL